MTQWGIGAEPKADFSRVHCSVLESKIESSAVLVLIAFSDAIDVSSIP